MRTIILALSLYNLSMACLAADSNKSIDGTWYDSAKTSASKALSNTKEAAKIGIDKTTKFINKTGQATKQGYKAFKKSFSYDKSGSTNTENSNKALPPAYLSVRGFKFCLAIKEMGSYQNYCLPKYRPAMCEKSYFEKLKKLNSPAPC